MGIVGASVSDDAVAFAPTVFYLDGAFTVANVVFLQNHLVVVDSAGRAVYFFVLIGVLYRLCLDSTLGELADIFLHHLAGHVAVLVDPFLKSIHY